MFPKIQYVPTTDSWVVIVMPGLAACASTHEEALALRASLMQENAPDIPPEEWEIDDDRNYIA